MIYLHTLIQHRVSDDYTKVKSMSTVRFPTIDDLHEVINLLNSNDNNDLSLSNSVFNKSNFIDQYAQQTISNQSILLLEIEDKICGMICWDYIFYNTVPLVSWLYIKKDYRNKNYANLLTSTLYDLLRKKGYKRLLYSIHESVKDPSSINPHGYLEWPDNTKEIFYWMKLAE